MEGVIKNAAKSEATQLIVAKAVAMSVLGLASFTVGLLPIKLTKLLNLKADGGKNLVISLLLCFGGGVLLFTTFLHLQPEVRESFAALEAEGKIPEIGHGIQMAELVFCLGFFLVYVIEEVVHMCLHRKPNDDTLHRSLSVRYKDNKKENLTIPRVTLNKFDDGNISYISTSNKKLLTSQTTINFENGGHNHSHMVNLKNSFSGLLTVIALSFHAVFEGLAVGLEDSVQKVWYLFMAIATHKLVIAFCVGVELASSKTKAFLIILYMGTFAIVTPLGIGIGLILSESSHLNVTSVVLQGMAGGTLLYVVFFEVLARERDNQHRGIWKFFAILAGFAVMFCLQFLTGHEHNHGGGGHNHAHDDHHFEVTTHGTHEHTH